MAHGYTCTRPPAVLTEAPIPESRMSHLRILVTGCKGRMGPAVLQAVEGGPDCVVGATMDVGDSLESALAGSDAVIDFTSHHFSDELVAECVKLRKALIMGTTGHTADELARLHEGSKIIPLVL